MQESYINKILEVHHIDGWKFVIQKDGEESSAESEYFNLDITYHEDKNGEWTPVKSQNTSISSLILPEFISALQEFLPKS